MYSPIRIENIRFGLCWHQQYQFIARPWPKIRQSICNLHHWKCDYEYENSWIFKNMIGINHLIQLPSCSRLLLVLQVGHSRHFLITSPNILTLQHQENSAIYFWWDMATIVKLFVFTLQDKDNCLKKTFAKGLNTQYLYSSEEKNLETMRHDR